MNLEILKHPDLFVEAVDYINFVPTMNIDDFMLLLEQNKIKAIKKFSYNNNFVFIVKEFTNYLRFFKFIKTSNIGHLSRIDIKFDILVKYQNFINDFSICTSERKVISKGTKKETIYIGSRNSDIFCRIYDKRAESKLDFNLTRIEFEIKNDVVKEASARLFFFGFDDFVNFLIKKIYKFCTSNNLYFFEKIKIVNPVPFNFFIDKDNFDKLNYFIKHNSNSFNELCKTFNIDTLTLGTLLENDIKDDELLEYLNKL